MPLSPLQRYNQWLRDGEIVLDHAQQTVVEQIDRLYWQLTSVPKQRWLKRPQPIKGLYLWGDVGRGKTFLMDLFYHSLSETKKLRLHFHRFMAMVHSELRVLEGHKDPLKLLAKRLSKQCKVLCFDEFFVADIGDAMILGKLFAALFESGVTLVATSNLPIEGLYANEHHRHRFDPARLLLKQYTQEIHVDGEQDHRLRYLQHRQTYYLNDEVDTQQLFDRLNTEDSYSTDPIILCNRALTPIRSSGRLIWFDFAVLCTGPRSHLDYIDLAGRFSTVIVSNIPQLGGECINWIKARGTEDGSFGVTATGERVVSYARTDDPARRFISLVDELYDRRVNLYLTAEVPLEYLYTQGALSFEFKRTYSRLSEMQSQEYLDQEQPL